MRTRALRAGCAVLAGSLLIGGGMHASAQDEPQRILVIHGNADIGVWEQTFNEAFFRTVSVDPRVRVTVEFLQLTSSDQEELALVAESVRRRISSMPTDLVIAIQPAATHFLLGWGDVFAADVERLYVLPGSEELAAVRRTGRGVVLESAVSRAARETMQLIPRLVPGVRRVFVVGGASAADSSYARRVLDAVESSRGTITVTPLLGLAPEELVHALGTERNKAVIMGTYDTDHSGKLHRTADITSALREHAEVPVFGLFDSVVGNGALGGSVTNSSLYGLKTAEISLGILSGKLDVDATSPTTQYLFDGRELRRLGIRRGRLPAGSRVLNDAPAGWREYLIEILAGLGVIMTQTLLIVALLKSLRSRKNAERERDQQWVGRENQVRLFESVVNTITAAFVILDLDENIVAGNDSGFGVTFGCAISEWIGQPVHGLFDPDTPRDRADSFSASLTQEPSIRLFYRCDGSTFPGEYYGGEITDIEGRRTGYFALIRNVTERLEEEEEVRQAHKMEALGNLAGGVAHDFNNILMAISGCAEVAGTSLQSPDEVQSHLSHILTASERGKRLVSQILTFSRRDDDEALATVDLSALLRESAALLEASLPKSIAITTRAPADLWNVRAKATHLQQVVMNLSANSTYAMEGSGRLSIGATNLSLSVAKRLLKDTLPPGRYVRVTVTDTGSGIPEEHLPRVLEPFFTTKPPGKGTGMGLASVYGIVEAHGAYLDIQSTLGRGTTVTLYLVPSNEAVPRPLDGASEAPRGSGETVLLVDDEDLVLHATRRMLAHLGYQVVSFSNPVEALELFGEDPDRFDLVMSDRSMPEMDGVSLLCAISRIRPGIPTILCTGFADGSVRADDGTELTVLNKPCRVADIASAASQALSRQLQP